MNGLEVSLLRLRGRSPATFATSRKLADQFLGREVLPVRLPPGASHPIPGRPRLLDRPDGIPYTMRCNMTASSSTSILTG